MGSDTRKREARSVCEPTKRKSWMSEGLTVDLNHQHSPLFLRIVNWRIQQYLLDIDRFSEEFAYATQLRHKIVLRELKKLSGEVRRNFVENELNVNRDLEDLTSRLLHDAKSEVIQLKRNEAAVKRYR